MISNMIYPTRFVFPVKTKISTLRHISIVCTRNSLYELFDKMQIII